MSVNRRLRLMDGSNGNSDLLDYGFFFYLSLPAKAVCGLSLHLSAEY